jgi:hypothetical protein
MNKVCWLLLGIGTILVGRVTPAAAWQAPSAEHYYSRGVHHYFSGCDHCAEESLTLALSWAPDDPRPYYFRALARLRTGQEFAARDDMQLGAELEAQSRGQYGIGRALERIQGPDRLLLEKYRRQARQAHDIGRTLLNRTRQEQLLKGGDAVERRRVLVPLEGLTGDATADVFAPEAEPRRPEAIELQPAVTPQPVQPPADAAPVPTGEEDVDPFRDDPQEAAPLPEQPAGDEAEPMDERPADESTGDTPEEEFSDDLFIDEENPFDEQ